MTPSNLVGAVGAVGVVAAILLGLGSAGCVTTQQLEIHRLDPALPKSAGPKADDPADADAVVLKREIRYLLVNPPRKGSYSDQQLYQAVKILTEKGFDAASEHVFVPSGSTLTHLAARTITRDGQIVPVDTAAILADDLSVSGKTSQTRSFRFPRVEVGAILELTWTIRHDDVYWTVSDQPIDRWPVRVYDVEIVLDRYTQPDLLVNNTTVPLGYTKDADGTQHVTLHLENLKSSASEAWRPDGAETDPWWLYRAIAWQYPAYNHPGVSTWGRALGAMHKLVVDGEGLEGSPGLRVVGGNASCAGDVACLADAALTQVRDDAVLSGFDGFFQHRPLADVVASGTANNHEKAIYLWSLLKKGGLDAHLAALGKNASPIVETFPSPAWLDHTIVWVSTSTTSAQEGLWLDPSCEHCAAGELPPWTLGSKALIVDVVGGEYGDTLSTTKRFKDSFAPVTGKPAAVDGFQRTMAVVVSDNGDVEVATTEVAVAGVATTQHIETRTWSEKDAEESAMDAVDDDSAAARVVEAVPWTCDRAAGSCTWRHRTALPAWATVDEQDDAKGSLLLPLSLLGSSAERSLASKHARKLPVVLRDTRSFDEELRITAPPGWTIDADHLKPAAARTEGLAVAVTVKRDGDALVVHRRHDWTPGRFPKEHWVNLQSTMKASTAMTGLVVRLVPPGAARKPAPAPAPKPAPATPTAPQPTAQKATTSTPATTASPAAPAQ